MKGTLEEVVAAAERGGLRSHPPQRGRDKEGGPKETDWVFGHGTADMLRTEEAAYHPACCGLGDAAPAAAPRCDCLVQFCGGGDRMKLQAGIGSANTYGDLRCACACVCMRICVCVCVCVCA